MTRARLDLGRHAEDLAAEYLLRKDYDIIERNFRGQHGEVDLIAQKDGVLAFVEVRSRREKPAEWALASVDQRKKRRVISAAKEYLAHNIFDLEPEVRFDVVAIGFRSSSTEIVHVEGGFCS